MPSTLIAALVMYGEISLAAATLITHFAVSFSVSLLVTKLFSVGSAPTGVDPGNRQQVPPSSTNAIPIVYGDAYLGGTFIDAALSADQKTMFYVLAVSCISPSGQFTFDATDILYGKQKVTFKPDGYTVASLTDDAGNSESKIGNDNLLQIFLYRSSAAGVITPLNSSLQPASVMTPGELPTHHWAGVRQMNGLAFAIVRLVYNRDVGTTSLDEIEFKCSHYLNGTGAAKPGDVWYDYITSPIYGGAVPSSFVGSPTALNVYSDELISYTPSGGGSAQTQPRYRINGVLGSGVSALENISTIMSSCDSWLSYQASSGQWVVVINKSQASAFAFDDSNIVGAIRVSATDISQSINQIESKYPFKGNRDQPAYINIKTPTELLYPNEPVNKASLTFGLVNDSVQAGYLSNRLLEQAREDLLVSFSTTYAGIQIDAGDVVSLTSVSHGWSAKLFRVLRVNEASLQDGGLGARLELSEYSDAVYDDAGISAYAPVANSGIKSPLFFGVLPPPVVLAMYPNAAMPTIVVSPYLGQGSLVTIAEVWYSAYASPSSSQMYLAGITQSLSMGDPYSPGSTLPPVTFSLPAGNWYFFTKLINSLASSSFSPPSTVIQWRPTTFQYSDRYLAIVYGDSLAGAGFSLNLRNKSHYGLRNVSTANVSNNPGDYTWYSASPTFGASNFTLYANRGNRKFSFATGPAANANDTGAFVPTETSIYDASVWAGLRDGANTIDLDARTGQITRIGTTSVSSADGLLSVSNNTNGSMVVSLEKFLNFGAGVTTKTANVAQLTIDVYGRVVGFASPDEFFFTESVFSATGGQSVFSVAHIVGDVLVFRDGVLMDVTEYTESGAAVTMGAACAAGEKIVVVNMRVVSAGVYYESLHTSVVSSSGNTVTYSGLPNQLVMIGDVVTFSNNGTPAEFTVQSINDSSKVITFTGAVSGATIGSNLYRRRAALSNYRPFSRFTVDLTDASSFTPTTWGVASGYELLFVNGVAFSEIDYDINGNTINGFPAGLTGKLTVIQFSENNLTVPAPGVTNTAMYSINSQASYAFSSNPLTLSLYANGAMLVKGHDFSSSASAYTLTPAIPNSFTLLNQQTFARIGAA